MKRVATCLALFFLQACGLANAPCRSLQIGQSTAGLPTEKITFLPNTVSPETPERFESFTKGPALQDYACSKCEAGEGTWCAHAADAGFACESEALRGIKEWNLGKPYSFEYDPPANGWDIYFSWQFCFIGEKDGSILSVWSRYRGD